MSGQLLHNLYPIADPDFNLVCLEPGKILTVNTQDGKTGELIDTYTYKYMGQTLTYTSTDNPVFTSCYLYPKFIKVRNNRFQLFPSLSDSLHFQSQKLQSVITSTSGRIQSRSFYYYGDTAVIEIYSNQTTDRVECRLYGLDRTQNLLFVRYAVINEKNLSRPEDFSTIDFSEEIKFHYNRFGRVERIGVYELNEHERYLRMTQHFEYRNKRPFKSTIRDEKANLIFKRATYTYSAEMK
jgi:hypothetical protein